MKTIVNIIAGSLTINRQWIVVDRIPEISSKELVRQERHWT